DVHGLLTHLSVDASPIHLRHLLLAVARPGYLVRAERGVESATSSAPSKTAAAPAFSSRCCRRLLPGIGTMSWPLCSSQASALCPGVTRFLVASSRTADAARRLASKFPPW